MFKIKKTTQKCKLWRTIGLIVLALPCIGNHAAAQLSMPIYGTPKVRALIPQRTQDVQWVMEVVNTPQSYQHALFGWTYQNFTVADRTDFLPAFDGRMDAVLSLNGQTWVAGSYGISDGRIWTGVVDTTGTRSKIKDWGHAEISGTTNSMEYVKALFATDPDTLQMAGGFYSPVLGNRIFMATIDTLGQVARVSHTPLDGEAYLRASIPDDQNGAFLAGMTRIAGGGNPDNEIFVARYSKSGQILWRQNLALPGFSGHNLTDLAQNPVDGTLYFIGQGDSAFQTHLLFGKINADGTQPTLTDIGQVEQGEYRIAISPNGRIVIGWPASFGQTVKIWEVDPLGNRIQYFLPISTGMKEIHQLRWADSQSLWAAGHTRNVPFDTLYVDRISMPTVGINEAIQVTHHTMHPFPNPAQEFQWIDLRPLCHTPMEPISVTLIAPNGGKVGIAHETEWPYLKITRGKIPRGLYLIIVTIGQNRGTAKVIWE